MLIASIIHNPCPAQIIITARTRFHPNCLLASSPLRRSSPFVRQERLLPLSDHRPVLTTTHQHPLCDQKGPSGQDFVWPKEDGWPWPIGTNWDQLETLRATRRSSQRCLAVFSVKNKTALNFLKCWWVSTSPIFNCQCLPHIPPHHTNRAKSYNKESSWRLNLYTEIRFAAIWCKFRVRPITVKIYIWATFRPWHRCAVPVPLGKWFLCLRLRTRTHRTHPIKLPTSPFSHIQTIVCICVFVCACPAKGAEYVNMEAQRSHNHSLAKLPRLDGSRFSLAASGWISWYFWCAANFLPSI